MMNNGGGRLCERFSFLRPRRRSCAVGFSMFGIIIHFSFAVRRPNAATKVDGS
nr:MAG TPA: hypothetical protein [Caudoviricetes sp.]